MNPHFFYRCALLFFGLIAPCFAQTTGAATPAPSPAVAIVSSDIVWMLVSSVLVILMIIPGLALFYSGMVRKKNTLSIIAQIIGSCGVVTFIWVIVGYSLAFAGKGQYIGDFSAMFFEGFFDEKHIKVHDVAPNIPEASFALFQLTFAMITVALIFGAVVERFRFVAAMWFAGLWCLCVYVPVARWIWHPEGWLHAMGHLDFAGGTVVHFAAGIAAVVVATHVGPRHNYGKEVMEPSSILTTVTGTGLLWTGWFGFNGGSGLAANLNAISAVLATQVAAGAGMFGWMLMEYFTRKRVSLLGLASGLICGLVVITPASGFVNSQEAVIMGLVGGSLSFLIVTKIKEFWAVDDSLDVFCIHGMAGLMGTFMTGFFAKADSGPPLPQTLKQLIGIGVVGIYVAFATWIVIRIVSAITALRVSVAEEKIGLDLVEHGESLE